MADIKIAYIGGGSRGWAWRLMSDLAMEGAISGEIKLYDIDQEASKSNEIIGNKLSQRPDVVGKWHYRAVETLQEALEGSDFIIISILPGTFEEMASDVHTPEAYKIYQSVGDTCGPGGVIRALRTIPMYVDIAENIKAYASDAWVINYTNPMTLCMKTLYSVFPKIKAFGCCHEVFGTQRLLASMLEEMEGIKEISREEIKINVKGINHFTWIDSAYYKGTDLMPLYEQFVDRYYNEGYQVAGDDHWLNSFFESANRVKFDLFKRYGIIAAAGDRHLAEFMPPWYLKTPEIAQSWKFTLTPVSWRKENRQQLIEESQCLYSGEKEVVVTETGEDGVKQIKALLGIEPLVTNVNIPNTGQISNLPLGAIVETNALFTTNSVQAICAGALPYAVHSLVNRHVLNQENLVKAILEKDKEQVFHVFMNEPLMTLDANEGRELFEKMIRNTSSYLEDWCLK
ncbi:alpha-glucosidase/alpha-galactosidase [Fusibacter sp. 3D3]|uniref:family 4 glycosyl hydrolase n=1 Tax=Fusibacter sp. 3D3 TaxID=1048380 RepID=UPI000857D324|nr:alpha-galactosidase [Fusibacter sp. 3D3]